MRIEVRHFYFIKDAFFDFVDDVKLMKNREKVLNLYNHG